MVFADNVARIDRHAQALLGERTPVVYTPLAGAPVPVIGIFDDAYVLTQGDAESGVEARVPSIFLVLADLPTDPMIDEPTLTIAGVVYRVQERQPARFGSIRLMLRKVI
jgi:hypothetical protein